MLNRYFTGNFSTSGYIAGSTMITDLYEVITLSVRRLHLEIVTADIEDICRIINFNQQENILALSSFEKEIIFETSIVRRIEVSR